MIHGGDHMSIQRPIVTHYPENSETPLSEMRSWVTPNVFFFVRNHFDEPDIAPETWKLQVHGQVRSPRLWTWEELASLPERTVFATMECAGTGRSFLHRVERAEGDQLKKEPAPYPDDGL